MTYLSQQQLESMNFKKLGKNIQISDKATIYYPEQLEIGDHSRIDDFCVISGNIKLGSYIHITAFCLIAGGEKGIVIGDYCGIGYASQIFTQSDDYSGKCMISSLVPEKYKGHDYKSEVTIDRHVIIGANSIILPGVHVTEGCSIGAKSLVTKSTDPWGLYFGIPAKRIKEKSRDVLSIEKQFLDEAVS